jgi:hypothetical protein
LLSTPRRPRTVEATRAARFLRASESTVPVSVARPLTTVTVTPSEPSCASSRNALLILDSKSASVGGALAAGVAAGGTTIGAVSVVTGGGCTMMVGGCVIAGSGVAMVG